MGQYEDSYRAIPGHGWIVMACAMALLGLFAVLLGTARLQPAGERVVQAWTTAPGVIRLELALPDDDSRRWALWFPREPVGRLQLVADDGWQSPIRSFFRVGDDEVLLSSGYAFPLPRDMHGRIQLEVHTEGGLHRRALQPVLAPLSGVQRVERSSIALASAVYGGLLMLATLALVLAYASRGRLFIVFFGQTVALVLLLLASSGHLYGLPVLRWFGVWRLQGLSALMLVHAATCLWLVEAYVLGRRRYRHARTVRGLAVVLVVAAVVCLLNLPWLARVAHGIAAGGVAVAGLAMLCLFIDAGRRRVPMAWSLAIAAAASIAAGLWMAASRHGLAPAGALPHLVHHGVAIVFALMLMLALIRRIGDYRQQRNRDRLARLDTERRMRRESARADLSAALQVQLRNLEPGEITWHGFRLLMAHLLPLVPTESCTAILRGYRGGDHFLVEPASARAEMEREIERRSVVLRRQAMAGLAYQQPLRTPVEGECEAVEALVPLQVRSPGWGLLLLRRDGDEGFTDDEMAVVGELVRVAQLHVDQATAAVKLRRSAEMDALTGSMNRRTIDAWCERAFNDAEHSGRPVAVLFIDLDHFKSVNDRYGHACGDECLRALAGGLRSVLGDTDMLGRYGGEEFIAMLLGRDGAEAREIGERMRVAVENLEVIHEGQRVRLTASIGIATRRPGESSPAAAIARADKALYEAKRQGRNCVQVAPAVFS